MKIKYIIQITLTTVLGPHKIMVARGFTKKPRIETVVCVVFSFFFILTYYTSEDYCWGGIMEVVAWFMANTFIKKYFKAGPPSPHHNLYLIIVEINLFYVQFFLFCSRSEKSKFN